MGDDPAKPKSPLDAFLKLLRDLIPDNIAAAATDMNILGIIFFSVFFGVALSLLGHEEGCGQIIRGVEAFNQVIIKMARTALDDVNMSKAYCLACKAPHNAISVVHLMYSSACVILLI